MIIETINLIDNNYKIEKDSVPLRIWTSDWPIPKEVKLKEYFVNLNTNHKTNVNLNRHGLWGKIEKISNFKRRTYRNNNPNQWGKGKKSGRRFDYKQSENDIWIKILSKSHFFNIKNRKFFFDNKYLRMTLHPREIGLWYLSRDGQVRFTIFPKFIKLNKEFFELIGILDGEMCKKVNKSGGSSLKISNAEPIIIQKLIKFFKNIFNIHPTSWTASLTINNKNSGFKGQDEGLKRFWSKKTNIPLNNFTKTSIQNKYRSKFSKKGIIQIRYSNTLFFITLLKIMETVRGIILKKKKYCEAYIRGLAAGEGGIGKREDKDKLRIVHIGGVNEEDKEFYSKCLSKLSITSIQRYKLRVEICRLENFLKLAKMDIFRYHPKRKREFVASLSSLKKNYR